MRYIAPLVVQRGQWVIIRLEWAEYVHVVRERELGCHRIVITRRGEDICFMMYT